MKNNNYVGWEEWVSLPELNLPALLAKTDTGAETSALHAFNIQTFGKNNEMVRFGINPIDTDERFSIFCSSKILDQRNVEYDEIFLRDNKIVLKFVNIDQQLESKTILQNRLLDRVIIALNLEPTTPDWLKELGGKPLKLGLDLSGGVHFLLEVDIDTAQQGRLELLLDSYRKTFKEERLAVSSSSIKDLKLHFTFQDRESYNKALAKYKSDSPGINGLQYVITERPSSNTLLLEYSDIALREIRDYAVGQNLVTLRNRVNELGVSEPIVQRQGANRIVVQLPGVQDPTAAKKIIGKTANLEFRLEANSRTSPLRKEEFSFKDNEYATASLEKAVVVTGDRVTNANTGFDESGLSQVNITLDMQGGRAMQKATSGNIGRGLAVLFVEQKSNKLRNEMQRAPDVDLFSNMFYGFDDILEIESLGEKIMNHIH